MQLIYVTECVTNHIHLIGIQWSDWSKAHVVAATQKFGNRRRSGREGNADFSLMICGHAQMAITLYWFVVEQPRSQIEKSLILEL